MSASEARSVRLVGAAIAALSGLLGAASLLLHWWSTALGCRLPGCPHAVVTGWSGLGTARVLLLLLAPAGLLPLVAELMRPAARRWLALLAALAGLGGALLIVFRVAVGPIESVPAGLAPTGLARGIVAQAIVSSGSAVLAGPFVAFVACAGVAGGAMLSGLGHRFFDAAPAPVGATAAIWAACLVLVVSLWLPWVRPGIGLIRIDAVPLTGGLTTVSAWRGVGTLSVLLLLGALAVAGGGVVAAAFRWRAVFLALAVAGWLLAAFAVARTPFPEGPRFATEVERLVGYGAGYYISLGCSAAIVVVGLAAAFSDARAPDAIRAPA